MLMHKFILPSKNHLLLDDLMQVCKLLVWSWGHRCIYCSIRN